MSEDEIIERVNKFINITVLYGKTYGMTCDDLKKYQQVFRGLLDLYNKEKDSNQWLLKAFDESRNNNIELAKECCKIQQELKQEKEKNKELEDVVKLMSIALTPFETPTNGVIWTSSEVRNTFFETIKKIDSERLKELLEEE